MPPRAIFVRVGVRVVQRRREAHAEQVLHCLLCDDDRTFVLYESWGRTSLISRRRLDVRWRWECLSCGTRVPAGIPSSGLPALPQPRAADPSESVVRPARAGTVR